MNYESISSPAPFTVYEVEKCIGMLKRGKAPGIDGLSTEHIVYCHPIIIVQLTCLFNSMLKLGYVPDEFGTGVIIPLIKNATGDVSSTDNYRGITLSPILSKLFELCMLLRFSEFYSHLNFSLVSKKTSPVLMQFILSRKC